MAPSRRHRRGSYDIGDQAELLDADVPFATDIDHSERVRVGATVETVHVQIQPLVDQDVDTGEWGLVDQIETSARGHIPDDDQLLLQRMEDEQVRRALDRGCDRETVMDVLDVSQRSTFYKVKRACAYEFPLDAFSRGGRPAEDARSQDGESESGTGETAQQRLDTVDEDADLSPTETWGSDESAGQPAADTATLLSELAGEDESGDELHREVDAAIKTLEALRGEVE